MADRWSRAEIAARVDGLARRHQGDAFVSEITGFARSLEPADRSLLEEILLERAERESALRALRRRAEARGWLRRTFERAEKRAAELLERRRGV